MIAPAICLMKQWLLHHKQPYVLGISKELSAAFNTEFREKYPRLYEVAKEHVRLCKRHTRRYGFYQTVYTYIFYGEVDNYPLPAIDPYPKAPTAAMLLADTAMLLAEDYLDLTR